MHRIRTDGVTEPNSLIEVMKGQSSMAPPLIVPVAKALYICDGHLGFANQKTDLMGLFNSINPVAYPHHQDDFVIFAQLIGGLGTVPFYVDVTHPKTKQLIATSNVHFLQFPTRATLVQLVYTMQNCVFPQDGIYLVELYCDGQWVADTTLRLR